MKYILFSALLTISIDLSAQDSGIIIKDYPMKIEWQKSQLESLGNPAAITDCEDDEIQWIYVDKSFSGGENGVIERTWMAEDDCGNKASTIQYIVLSD